MALAAAGCGAAWPGTGSPATQQAYLWNSKCKNEALTPSAVTPHLLADQLTLRGRRQKRPPMRENTRKHSRHRRSRQELISALPWRHPAIADLAAHPGPNPPRGKSGWGPGQGLWGWRRRGTWGRGVHCGSCNTELRSLGRRAPKLCVTARTLHVDHWLLNVGVWECAAHYGTTPTCPSACPIAPSRGPSPGGRFAPCKSVGPRHHIVYIQPYTTVDHV